MSELHRETESCVTVLQCVKSVAMFLSRLSSSGRYTGSEVAGPPPRHALQLVAVPLETWPWTEHDPDVACTALSPRGLAWLAVCTGSGLHQGIWRPSRCREPASSFPMGSLFSQVSCTSCRSSLTCESPRRLSISRCFLSFSCRLVTARYLLSSSSML